MKQNLGRWYRTETQWEVERRARSYGFGENRLGMRPNRSSIAVPAYYQGRPGRGGAGRLPREVLLDDWSEVPSGTSLAPHREEISRNFVTIGVPKPYWEPVCVETEANRLLVAIETVFARPELVDGDTTP
jgi:hypothetical protein